MKVTITTLNDEIFVLDVSEDLELENFKAFCEIESGFPAKDIILNYNGKPLLDDKKSLKEHGVHDGDVIVLLHMLQTASNLNQTDSSQGTCMLITHFTFLLCILKLHCHAYFHWWQNVFSSNFVTGSQNAIKRANIFHLKKKLTVTVNKYIFFKKAELFFFVNNLKTSSSFQLCRLAWPV